VEVKKYRAIADYSGEVTYQAGATLFVMGEPDEDGGVMVSGNERSVTMAVVICLV
jgi:hypothetical protein